MPSVVQLWVSDLTMMQQSVLFTAIRGPDGIQKEHIVKVVLRAFRREVLLSAMDGKVLETPYVPGGGSFTGPVPVTMSLEGAMLKTINNSDELPHHFLMHLAHASQIIGYKHPDPLKRAVWGAFYRAWCTSMHMEPESEPDMSIRLGDRRDNWLAASKTEIGYLESAHGPKHDPETGEKVTT